MIRGVNESVAGRGGGIYPLFCGSACIGPEWICSGFRKRNTYDDMLEWISLCVVTGTFDPGLLLRGPEKDSAQLVLMLSYFDSYPCAIWLAI